jgi:hypothetical protein
MAMLMWAQAGQLHPAPSRIACTSSSEIGGGPR